MTLSMLLKWRNFDASADVNSRFKTVFQKGFVSGAVLTPVPFVLQVTVSPFTLVTFDGAVVLSDATETVTVVDGVDNYVVCRARHVLLGSPTLSVEVLSAAAYAVDPELNWLHVIGRVDLTFGGPHASVPLANIFYEERHAVDPQGRSAWREPVATFAALPVPPADFNREGDIRLVLDTRSLYSWDETLGIWDLFDEAPVIEHRDHEHTNGITGDSAAGTLLPGVSVTNMTVPAVAVGSGYTVNGRYLTATAPLLINAASVGAVRGLLSLYIDQLGVLAGDYRVTKDADVLDIGAARLVDISDNHTTGTFTLTFNPVGNVLSWDTGEPVPVTTSGRYRLYRPDYLQWIEVEMSGALPGILVSDNYTVNASRKTDDYFLVGYYFWDGAAVLVLGTDKRLFGNIGVAEISDDYKDLEYFPPLDDLRGSMVYSGGAASSAGGLNLRLTGPIVAYLQGRRTLVAGSYNGVAIPASVTRYVYVDSAGALTVSATDPATVTGLVYADICSVVTGGVSITTITDRRDPQLIVGNATRDSRLRFTGVASARWNEPTDTLFVEKSGSTANVRVRTGVVRLDDNRVEAMSGALSFDDTNTPSPQAMTDAVNNDLAVIQPLNATPSVFGALADLQTGKSFNVGVASGCAGSIAGGVSVDVASGVFYDTLARRVSRAAATNVVIAGSVANGVYAICWDPDLAGGSFTAKRLDAGGGCDIQDLPFCVVVVNGTNTALSVIEDVRRFADGQYDRSFVTVAATAGFQDGNFSSLRQAMLHIKCFDDDEPAPREVRILGSYTEPHVAADGGSIRVGDTGVWTQSARLKNMRVVGMARINSTSSRAVVTFGTGNGFFIWFEAAGRLPMFSIENLIFAYGGANVPTDHNVCFARDPDLGFALRDCTISGVNNMTHLFYYSRATTQLGGSTTGTFPGVEVRRCYLNDVTDGSALVFFGDNTGINPAQVTSIDGALSFVNTSVDCGTASVFMQTDAEADTVTSALRVNVTDSFLSNLTTMFVNGDLVDKQVNGGRISTASAIATASSTTLTRPTLTGVRLSDANLTGAGVVSGCAQSSGTITLAEENRITGCSFTMGTVSGTIGQISNSRLNLGATGVLDVLPSSTEEAPFLSDCILLKENGNAQTNTMVNMTNANSLLRLQNTKFAYSNSGITNTDPVIRVTAASCLLRLQECDVRISNATRPNIQRLISMEDASSLAVFASRLLNGNTTVSSIDGIGIYATHSTSAPTIQVEDCEIDAQRAIVLATGGVSAAFWQSVSFNRNKIVHRQTSAGNGILIKQAKSVLFCDNIIRGGGTEATFAIGSTVLVDTDTQDTAVVSRNQFLFTTGAGSLTFQLQAEKYQNPTVNDNVIRRGGGTGTSAMSVEVTGVSGLNAQCCGNEITVTNAGVTSGTITVDDYVLATANRNSIRAEASTDTATGSVTLTGVTRNGLANDNNIAAVATGAFSATATVAADGGASARLAVANNQIQAETGTGSGDALITVGSCRQASVTDNQLSGTGGTASDANITLTDVDRATVSGGNLTSSGDVTVELLDCALCTASTMTIFCDDAVKIYCWSPGGAPVRPSVVGSVLNNTIDADNVEIYVGHNSTVSAVGERDALLIAGNQIQSSGDVLLQARGTASGSPPAATSLGSGSIHGNVISAAGGVSTNVTYEVTQLRAGSIYGNVADVLGGAITRTLVCNVEPLVSADDTSAAP